MRRPPEHRIPGRNAMEVLGTPAGGVPRLTDQSSYSSAKMVVGLGRCITVSSAGSNPIWRYRQCVTFARR
jgi:hypothetical protein